MSRLPGGKVGEFLKRHVNLNAAHAELDLSYKLLVNNHQDRESLAYMFSRPVIKLRKEVELLRTKSGQPVKLLLCFFPTGPSGFASRMEPYRNLWKETAAQAEVSFGDISDSYLALRPDYFPAAENFESFHPTPEGYGLKAMILCDFLIREKWISFDPTLSDKGWPTSK